MIKEGGLKDRVMIEAKQILDHAGGREIYPPSIVKETVDELITGSVQYMSEKYNLKATPEKIDELTKNINKTYGVEIGGHKARLLFVSYSRLWNRYQHIADLKKTESRTDYSERIRYLTFRILTAIGIAAVILVTGYAAKEWGIPLPLLRPL